MCELILNFVFHLEDLPDQNDSLIGTLEQSTNNSLFNFLTTTTPSSHNYLEDNFIGGENKNISVLPFQKDVEKKSTSNVHIFLYN